LAPRTLNHKGHVGHDCKLVLRISVPTTYASHFTYSATVSGANHYSNGLTKKLTRMIEVRAVSFADPVLVPDPSY